MKKIKPKLNRYSSTGSYTYQKPITPNKDNRMIYEPLPGDHPFYDVQISLRDGVECSSRVRVPPLKRKSAWKRFYKLYPHLKGKKTITGFTTSDGGRNKLNASTIKLKKVKK